jgi:predicted dehydrogenase/threonine dehydrogenase-like Zn-dependent dehydrogenase
MLQVIQYQKDGQMLVEELPAPACVEGGILVRNVCSLISAGTEKTSVTNTQSNMLERAKKQPKEVKMVMDLVKKEGLASTVQKVLSKLDSYKTLGYSTAGVVLESRCTEFTPGDLVACAGAGFAVHAEIITVPRNLAVKIPEGVSFEEASYATLGSIALQGVRQADLRLGENVAVIGLGLLGQITVQLLKASGCRVAGLDINESLFAKAKSYGCDETFASSKESTKSLMAFTNGMGFDAVIITASTGSNEPIELAIDIARKKSRVVVVGGIAMNLPRSPFYEKELDITISCSYGPGRYDANYEERGHDYPVGYVRWTENRNLQAILDLVSQGKLDVKSLTTHRFEIKDAVDAYGLITGKVIEPYLGIVLNYPERKDASRRTIEVKTTNNKIDKLKIAFIGAGSFAQSNLLPPLKDCGVEFIGVTTSTSVNALTAAKKFGFKLSGTDSTEMINNSEVNGVFCASRHDTHAQFVLDSVKSGKPIFVEKPLCVNLEQQVEIDDAVAKHSGRVMVGFNRRFSKPFKDIADFYKSRTEPMVISYRVNAGMPPVTSWPFQPEQGGGRIIGEGCHFIDTMAYLTGAVPVRVYAESISSQNLQTFNHDNVCITIKFSDGSVGTLQYVANGDSSQPKEYCEVYCESSSAVMNNFESVEFFRAGKKSKKTYNGKKGHNEEVAATVEAMRNGSQMPIEYDVIRAVTLATFAAIESIKCGEAIGI